MRFQILGVLGAIAVACVGACFGGTSDGTGASAAPLQCGAGQRGFNGSCRAACSETVPCAGTTICAAIDPTAAVCVEAATSCSYLGDDTVCAAEGGYYSGGGRGGPSTFFPYRSYPASSPIDPSSLTEAEDPYFTADYSGLNIRNDGAGCQGDAKWISIPSTGAVACRAKHTVRRCRLVNGYNCQPVVGTTGETVLPTP